MIGKVYKNKFAVLFVAMVLVLGLTLPACTCGEQTVEEPTTPPRDLTAPEKPVAGEFSFEAAEYTNADYGFSLKYPKDWKETEGGGPTNVFYAAAAARVPVLGVSIQDIEEDTTFGDVLTAVLEGGGASEVEIVSETETTLADGTPASEATVKLKAQGFGADCFALGAVRDNKSVIVTISTISLLAKYDEALFSEIAHTLQFD